PHAQQEDGHVQLPCGAQCVLHLRGRVWTVQQVRRPADAERGEWCQGYVALRPPVQSLLELCYRCRGHSLPPHPPLVMMHAMHAKGARSAGARPLFTAAPERWSADVLVDVLRHLEHRDLAL